MRVQPASCSSRSVFSANKHPVCFWIQVTCSTLCILSRYYSSCLLLTNMLSRTPYLVASTYAHKHKNAHTKQIYFADACFDCLPPYAASLAMNERNAYSRFINAIRRAGNGLPISPNTLNNDKVAKWAYNVALTRFEEIWQPSRQKLIAPLADLVRSTVV